MLFWEGASLWILGTRPSAARYPKTAFHSHHAVQVTLALRGGFTLESRDQQAQGQVNGAAAAVAPDTEHAFEAEGLIAHLFVDPEGRPGRALLRELFSDAPPLVSIHAERLDELPARLCAEFEAPHRNEQTLIELGRALLAQLAPGSGRDERPEARVRRMSAWAVAHRCRSWRRLFRLVAFQSHVPTHVRRRRGLAARYLALGC